MGKPRLCQISLACALAILVACAAGCERGQRPACADATPTLPRAREELTASSAPTSTATRTPRPATATPMRTGPAATVTAAPTATLEAHYPVATLVPVDSAIHGLIFDTLDGLEVIDEGQRRTIVTWSELETQLECLAKLSTDGRKVAYTRTGQDVWLWDLAAGRSTPLVEGGIRREHAEIMEMAWSPDDAWLAMLVGERNSKNMPIAAVSTLVTVETATGKVHEITQGLPLFCWLRPSGELAYLNLVTGEFGLFVVRPDGAGKRLLYQGPPDRAVELPSSPRDGTLLLVVDDPGDRSLLPDETLLALSPWDGSTVDLLAGSPGTWDYLQWALWSPDGERVAFLRGFPGELNILDTASGEVKRWGTRFDSLEAWSPDGSALAAYTRVGGRYTYVVIDVGRGGAVRTLDVGTSCALEWR